MTITDIVMVIFIFGLVAPLMVVFAMVGPIGMLFAIFVFLASLPFTYMWYLERKGNRQREMKRREMVQYSAPIQTWQGSKAILIERPNQPIKISATTSLQLCPHLVKLSSVMIKCPKCQHVFPRFFAPLQAKVKTSEYSSLKNGTLSMTEMIRREIRDNGCPSKFYCPKCNTIIVHSREPSGMCQLFNKRVYGEKLFCCTINQCI